MTIISVGRQGQEIGDYYLDGIKEGLASGYFLQDDYGWHEGLAEWVPLPVVVENLTNPPSPPLPEAPASTPRIATAPAPHIAAVSTPKVKTKTKSIKQNLKAQNGEVTYVLKKEKVERKAKAVPGIHSWQNDPATDKQIAFLTRLGVRNLPATLTKGEAHNQIDALLVHGQAHYFLSPKQRACLHYYGLDEEKMDFEEAKHWLERVHESPKSFNVPEPWETAKYRLYPTLYPASERPRRSGCAALILGLLFSGAALFYFLLRSH